MMRWLSHISPYSVGTFVFVMVLMLGISTIVWDKEVDGKLYHCTDALFFDFLQPGNWVHGKIDYVPEIDVHRSMSLHDEVKEGWTVFDLWLLWSGFWFASAAISCAVASIPWILERSFAICRPSKAH